MIAKKTLSLLLLLAFITAGVPAVVWAEDVEEVQEETREKIPVLKEVEEDDSLDELLDDLTSNEVDKALKASMAERLRIERQQVAVEINNNVLFDEEDIDKAKAILLKGKNTQADNIKCIMRAFATCDPDFKKMCDLRADNKIEEVVKLSRKNLNLKERNYFSAVKHYFYAEVMSKGSETGVEGAQDYWDAIDAYGNIIANMPDKISFAASASIKTGDLLESHGRLYYAIDQYTYTLKHYSLTLSSEDVAKLTAKIEANQKIYADPMIAIADKMGRVGGRLDEIDSGKVTQDQEQEVVAILTDLIKVMEEAQKKDPNAKKKPGNKKKESGPPKPGEGKPGPGKPGGQKPGGKGTPKNKATSPAQSSYLPKAHQGRIEVDSIKRDALEESGDWSQLPPRDKQIMKDLLQKKLSEQNREAIRLYFIERSKIKFEE